MCHCTPCVVFLFCLFDGVILRFVFFAKLNEALLPDLIKSEMVKSTYFANLLIRSALHIRLPRKNLQKG